MAVVQAQAAKYDTGLKRPRVALHSYTYGSYARWTPCYTLDKVVERAAAFGYTAIEIGAGRPHAWPQDLDSAARRGIKALVHKNGLEVAAICPFNYNCNPASPIAQERKDAARHYADCVRLAAELACGLVVFVPGWRVSGTSCRDAWNWAIDAARCSLQAAEELGIELAIEPINSSMTNLVTRTEDALRMAEEVGSPRLNVMIDTFHLLMEREDPAEAVRITGDRLAHVHCSDGIPSSGRRAVPGEGQFDFESFRDALLDAGYAGYISVELWGQNPDWMARESVRFLRKLGL